MNPDIMQDLIQNNENVLLSKVYLQDNLREYCGNCKSLCEDIAYNYETTIVELQNNSVLWNAPTDAKQRPHWYLTIMHISSPKNVIK